MSGDGHVLEARGQRPNVVRMQGLELSLQSAEVKHQNHIERTCAATEDSAGDTCWRMVGGCNIKYHHLRSVISAR